MRKSDGSSAYANVCYAPRASCDELYAGAKEFVSFIKSEARNSFIGHILTFAWNEFEEGDISALLTQATGRLTRLE